MKATTITEDEIERIHDALRDAWSEYSEWIKVADARAEDGQDFPFRIDGTKSRREKMRGANALMHKLRWALDDMSAHERLRHERRRSRGNPHV